MTPMPTRGLGPAVMIGALLAAVGLGAQGTTDFRLIEAATRGDREAVRALITQGVDVNAAQPDSTTALHWAPRPTAANSAPITTAGPKTRVGMGVILRPRLAFREGSSVVA